MKALHKLFAMLKPGLAPLENRLLAAVSTALRPEARSVFQLQIESVNKVQRLGAVREVNLYRMRGHKPYNEPAISFLDRRREVELAQVTFRLPGEYTIRKVSLYTVDGFLFCLIFDPPAASIMHSDDIEIVEVKLKTDPMQAHYRVQTPPAAKTLRLTGHFKRWQDEYGVSDLRQPLREVDHQTRIGEIPAALPAGYLELVKQTDGLQVGNWTIYGLADSYGISLDDAEYQVLAELRDWGVLAVEKDKSELYLVPFDGSARRSTAGFVNAIESQLTPPNRTSST